MSLITIPTVLPPAKLPPQPSLRPSREIPTLPGLLGWWTMHEQMRFTATDGGDAIRTLGPEGMAPPLRPGQAYGVPMPFETITAPNGSVYRLSRHADRGSNDSALNRHWGTTVNLAAGGWVSLLCAARSWTDSGATEAWSIALTPGATLFSSPHKTGSKSSILLGGTPNTQVDFARANTDAFWWEVVAFSLATGEVRRCLNGAAIETATLPGLAGQVPPNPCVLKAYAKAQSNPYRGNGCDFAIAAGNYLDPAAPAPLTYIDRYLDTLYGI